MSGAIRALDLAKSYGRASVLKGLAMEVPAASVFGLVGPNGAGKTTTIKILMNIIQPSSGRAEVLGVDSRRLGPDDYARIGYVSENQDLPDWMTIGYLLSYLKPFYPTWDDTYAAELVKQFDLPLSKRIKHLSRGMAMKAAFVGALAYHPRVIVLDEPFSGLDPLVREDLTQGILDSAGESTILVSSHDLGDIESFATHIGYLDGGRLQVAEEMASLTARFREIEVVVDPPATIPPPQQWPSSWVRPETSAALVRFVETRFDPERTVLDVRQLFGSVRNISANPMSLRAIFLSLARGAARTA